MKVEKPCMEYGLIRLVNGLQKKKFICSNYCNFEENTVDQVFLTSKLFGKILFILVYR